MCPSITRSRFLQPPEPAGPFAGDGFALATAAGAYSSYRSAMALHLRRKHPALALVEGMGHWIVVAGIDDECVLVLDGSGCADPSGGNRLRYRLTHEGFAGICYGVVLVRRCAGSGVMTALDYAREYVRGTVFALACAGAAVPK